MYSPGIPMPRGCPLRCMPTFSTCSWRTRWPSARSGSGTPVDLSSVESDSVRGGARNDHLTAWKACYATTRLMGGASQFALSSSGHIQSLVNPPGNPRMSVATPEASEGAPAALLTKPPVTGSWWEPWSNRARPARATAVRRRPRSGVRRTRPAPHAGELRAGILMDGTEPDGWRLGTIRMRSAGALMETPLNFVASHRPARRITPRGRALSRSPSGKSSA